MRMRKLFYGDSSEKQTPLLLRSHLAVLHRRQTPCTQYYTDSTESTSSQRSATAERHVSAIKEIYAPVYLQSALIAAFSASTSLLVPGFFGSVR